MASRQSFLQSLVLTSCALLVVFAAIARADNITYGTMDFTRLSKEEEKDFWFRLSVLAGEEAWVTYCSGKPTDFEKKTIDGIRSCVTKDALDKADNFFQAAMKRTLEQIGKDKGSCTAHPKKPFSTNGYLGVNLADADVRPHREEHSPSKIVQAVVVGVTPRTPAAEAEILPGDVITEIDGDTITNTRQVITKIRALAPGTMVSLSITRKAQIIHKRIKLKFMEYDADGKIALDIPEWLPKFKAELERTSSDVIRICQSCKTSVLSLVCR